MTNTRLEMFFLNQSGKKSKMSVDNPRIDLNEMDIQTTMQTIIDKNIFNTTGGDLVAISSARVVTTDVNDIIGE